MTDLPSLYDRLTKPPSLPSNWDSLTPAMQAFLQELFNQRPLAPIPSSSRRELIALRDALAVTSLAARQHLDAANEILARLPLPPKEPPDNEPLRPGSYVLTFEENGLPEELNIRRWLSNHTRIASCLRSGDGPIVCAVAFTIDRPVQPPPGGQLKALDT